MLRLRSSVGVPPEILLGRDPKPLDKTCLSVKNLL
jgi:hypothetical protein